ncbi:MAG: hypothetical protein JO246_17725 [Frankiaceae bacterium]|nr:hypothetical protein [Frankiaceae bacterium]MBV9869864.1 hypothetical protein [Frankiaceae bacterium]
MSRSKHATVVAYLALFVALSGSAWAATGNGLVLGHNNRTTGTTSLTNTHSGPALRLATRKLRAPALAISNDTKIRRLNADKLDGLSASAFEAAAVRLLGNTTSATAGEQVVNRAGPWTFKLDCRPSSASFVVHGPGTAMATRTVAIGASVGRTFVTKPAAIGTAFSTTASTGQQVSQTLLLLSNTTLMHVDTVLTATHTGSVENCGLVGTAIRS